MRMRGMWVRVQNIHGIDRGDAGLCWGWSVYVLVFSSLQNHEKNICLAIHPVGNMVQPTPAL